MNKATMNSMTPIQIRDAQAKSIGRAWSTATRVEHTRFNDGERIDFFWDDGALVSVWHDKTEHPDAVALGKRYGFFIP